MHIRAYAASLLGALSVLSVAPVIASADALSVSCSGSPSATAITWTASTTGGIAPIALLWGNGATSSSQTVLYAPGLQSISLQATDASSTVATTTCSATVPWPLPSIASFAASPSSIVAGQSATLSWNVANASSTAIAGLPALTGTATTVSPTVTSVYTLSAVNPSGTTTATATITVTPAATSTTPGVLSQIQALLAQIRALQQQIAQLVAGAAGTGSPSTGTTTPPTLPVRYCLELGRDIRFGDRGDDVRKLQQMLAADPAIFADAQVTGFFGEKTLKAVMKFQRKYGIASTTGFVGPQTRALFKSHCGTGLVTLSASSTASTTLALPPGIFKKLEDDKGRGQGRGEGRGRDD